MGNQPVLIRGQHHFRGVLAEILSLFVADPVAADLAFPGIIFDDVLAALDTAIPAEERVVNASQLARSLNSKLPLSSWLPGHDGLPDLEYQQMFASQYYSGYRDHSVHALQVYILGWYLYLTCSALRDAVMPALTSRAPCAGNIPDRELFREWWSLAALWHDLGYPFEAASFIDSSVTRRRICEKLAQDLGNNPFPVALQRLSGRPCSPNDLRTIYSAGGYYPWNLENVDLLLKGHRGAEIVNRFWRNLGASPVHEEPIDAIVSLTTQAPQGRPSYYDHGLLGSLLLGFTWGEVEKFVYNLTSSGTTLDESLLARAVREKAATELMERDGLVECAIEAISFHNIALRDWPDADLRRLWPDPSVLPLPSLHDGAHVFFLALCDVLQDWDRHHFIPGNSGRYKPSLRASDILLQGRPSGVAINLPDDKPFADFLQLFTGWLDPRDIQKLITVGASYSHPEVLHDAAAVTLSESERSRGAASDVKRNLERTSTTVRTTLLEGRDDRFAEAVSMIEDVWRATEEKRKSLLPRDLDDLMNSEPWAVLSDLQSMVASMIRRGRILPRGTVEEVLGYGGFGTVYLVRSAAGAEDPYLAYKVFHQGELQNTEKRRLFRRGFDAMVRLAHSSNIVRVVEFTDFPVGIYMQFIRGTDLEKKLNLAGDVHQRISMLGIIATTVANAHTQGIYHRDIKPSNVILKNDDPALPMLTDFDLAWMSGRSVATKTAYATMQYGAPEQFEERMAVFRTQPTVDVYSFGALAYYVLTGDAPPTMAAYRDEHFKILHDRLSGQILQVAMDDIEKMIRDCTAYHPDNRPQTMEDVLLLLRRAEARAWDDATRLDRAAFIRELTGVGGGSLVGTNRIMSITGASAWDVDMTFACNADITLRCSLMGKAIQTNVNYEEFKKNSARRIDTSLRRWAQFSSLPPHTARRSRSEGTSWAIELTEVSPTARLARSIATLMSDISRIIE